MNKKGFTLIELLAVIVVLAIIALIATPMVLNTIEDARRGAAQSSALAYISAVETKIAVNMLTDTTYPSTTTITDEAFATVKGDSPSAVTLKIVNGMVHEGSLTIGNYDVTFDGSNAVATQQAA